MRVGIGHDTHRLVAGRPLLLGGVQELAGRIRLRRGRRQRRRAAILIGHEAKMHVLNHHGRFFKVRGPLNVACMPQGHPVIVQAGASEQCRELGAATADVIYAIKRQDGLPQAVVLIRSLLRKHGLTSFVAGCTELHMVQKYWRRHSPVDCIDPLQIVADRIAAPIVVGSPREAGVQ